MQAFTAIAIYEDCAEPVARALFIYDYIYIYIYMFVCVVHTGIIYDGM